ncbi:MAG: exodeoxyribonuclease VII large subunit [Clostridia bacterium]|nr:exodeoxyribonuclease VII large subunit [Clostridia bacterium]
MNKFVFSVGELNRYVRSVLESDSNLSSLYVAGEISNFTNHYRSGHLYFTLSDSTSAIKCVMFASAAAWLKFRPENGMAVICRGRASVYEKDGVYQFYCEDMQPDGAGALALAFQQLKDKLEKEGLFDSERKRTLPRYPKKIGVITSDTGAAIRDILNVSARRYPLAEILFHPALVQGTDAPASLIKALDAMYKTDADVIIIGRGGGSAEDLSPFNDEMLARKIAAAPVPVISAVGHETDFSISDFVADVRAATPSAAAELAVPDIAELSGFVSTAESRISAAAGRIVKEQALRLRGLNSAESLKHPHRYYEVKMQQLDSLQLSLINSAEQTVAKHSARFGAIVSKLDALSPLSVIKRGYARVDKGAEPITRAALAQKGDKIKITMQDGFINCTVDSTEVDDI